MSARTLARISNHFEPSGLTIALGTHLTTREASALLGISPRQTWERARRMGVYSILLGGQCYWTPRQVEQLRGER